jgi:hypothetical protein
MYLSYFGVESRVLSGNTGRHNRIIRDKTAKILELYKAAFFESTGSPLPELIEY